MPRGPRPFPNSNQYFTFSDMVGIDPVPNEAKTLRVYGIRRPNTLKEITKTAATISFTHNASAADTLNDSGNGLATLGLQPFDRLLVSGSSSNDGEYTIASIAAGVITMHKKETVTTEAASASITITTVPAIDREHRSLLALGAAAKIAELYDLNDVAGKSRVPQLQSNFNDALARYVNDVDVDEGIFRNPHRLL